MNNLTLVIVALIGAGGPIMWLLSRFDRRNTEQHAANMDVLKDIQKDVKTIDQRLSSHIDWHVHDD
jgi:hypothetical protein